MSPDMQRLCEAVAAVSNGLSDGDREAIVRAVLTELREVSDACLHAGGLEAVHHVYRARGSANERREVAKDTLGIMIDHILAEPATA